MLTNEEGQSGQPVNNLPPAPVLILVLGTEVMGSTLP